MAAFTCPLILWCRCRFSTFTAEFSRVGVTALTGPCARCTACRIWLALVHGNGNSLPKVEKLIDRLTAIEGMKSISINQNTKKTNVILGDVTKCIWGDPYITDMIHLRDTKDFSLTDTAVAYHISPQSFYQVNPVQTEKLYSLALDYAGLTGKETVWDLYCGIGTISLFLAQKAGKVYGVEIVPQAIEDAKNNEALNGINNAEFFVGKAEEVLPAFYEKKKDMNHITRNVRHRFQSSNPQK